MPRLWRPAESLDRGPTSCPRYGRREPDRTGPDRGRCRSCDATHVVLPAWYVPRRAYVVEVVGSVLLAGAQGESRRRIAARLGVPAGTVASWLTAARTPATSLVSQAHAVAGSAVRAYRSAAHWLGTNLAEAIDALGDAARELATAVAAARPPRAGETGIDYLQLPHAQHRRDLHRQLAAHPRDRRRPVPPSTLAHGQPDHGPPRAAPRRPGLTGTPAAASTRSSRARTPPPPTVAPTHCILAPARAGSFTSAQTQSTSIVDTVTIATA